MGVLSDTKMPRVIGITMRIVRRLSILAKIRKN